MCLQGKTDILSLDWRNNAVFRFYSLFLSQNRHFTCHLAQMCNYQSSHLSAGKTVFKTESLHFKFHFTNMLREYLNVATAKIVFEPKSTLLVSFG